LLVHPETVETANAKMYANRLWAVKLMMPSYRRALMLVVVGDVVVLVSAR
jgi:hypothetical protein